MKTKILVVDDHAVFREGLVKILEQERDFSVSGEAEDAPRALALVSSKVPDMVIVDISLEGTSGLELTKTLRLRYPNMRILVLSMHKETIYAERCLQAGANGYVMKQESGRTLVNAIRHVAQGQTYVSAAVHELILQRATFSKNRSVASPIDDLSDRELEIFRLISQGYGTRQIADHLHISIKTVETHREHIREKLHLISTFELVQYAIAWASSSA